MADITEGHVVTIMADITLYPCRPITDLQGLRLSIDQSYCCTTNGMRSATAEAKLITRMRTKIGK